MQVRPFLLTLLGAAVVIAGAEFALRAVEQHLPVLSSWPTAETEVKSAQFAELDPRPTLLVLGSSMTESAVDPERLVAMGATTSAYNSAFPFFSPAAADLWLREVLKPSDDLEVLLIGLPVWPPQRDTASDPLTLWLLSAGGGESISNPFDDIALWRLRGMLADLDNAARRERTASLWTDFGHQTYYYGRSGESVSGRYPPYLYSTMSDVQERALRRIIETAQEKGVIPIVLVEPGNYPDEVDADKIASYKNWLRALAAELDVEFWDAHSIEWDDSLYADETHFNQKGTIEFSRYIGERLLELSSR